MKHILLIPKPSDNPPNDKDTDMNNYFVAGRKTFWQTALPIIFPACDTGDKMLPK
jgi:hypothetical protein